MKQQAPKILPKKAETIENTRKTADILIGAACHKSPYFVINTAIFLSFCSNFLDFFICSLPLPVEPFFFRAGLRSRTFLFLLPELLAAILPFLPVCNKVCSWAKIRSSWLCSLLRKDWKRNVCKFCPRRCSVQFRCLIHFIHPQVCAHRVNRFAFNTLVFMKIFARCFDRCVAKDALHDIQRHPVLHQPRCQRMPQRVRIDLSDLAAFGYRCQPQLKALGVKMRSGF